MINKRFIITATLITILFLGFSLFNQKDPLPQKTDATSIPQSMEILKFQTMSSHDRAPSMINDVPVWSESFDATTFPPTGWLNTQESGTGLWARATTTSYPSGFSPHSGAGLARFNSYSYSTGVSASLISLSFSLTAGQAKLGFWILRDGGYATNADLVNFYINTTPSSTGATLLGTINRSKSLTPVETGADGWYYYEFTIPASFNTATNYIIMKAVSAFGNDIYVDDAMVIPLLAHDIGVQSVDVSTPQMPGTIIPKATVKNNGSATETFPVTMIITPGSYTSTMNVTSLAGGTTNQITFANWSAAEGTYNVKVISQLGTDLDRSNDTLVKTVVISSAVWTTGTNITAGSYLGSGVGYTNATLDTAYLFSVAGNAPNGTAVYKYNAITNAWSTCAVLPDTRVVLATAVVKDTLYAIAGSNGTSYSNTLFKYNIRTNVWTTGTPLPTATLGWCKAAGYQDSLIYVCAGNDGTNAVATVYLYNAISGTWRTGTPLPSIAFGGGFAIAGNYLVYIGGIQGSAPGSATYKGLISQTDRSQITWTTGASYPGGTMWKTDAASWWGNEVIITTGTTGTTSTTWWTPASPNPCYTYDPATNVYSPKPNLTTPVLGAYLGSAKIAPTTYKLMVASGYTGTAAITNTQIFTETLVGIEQISSQVPDKYSLSQNYPNPFNPSTKINFALRTSGNVTMKIYNVLGEVVATPVNEFRNAGTYSVEFNASNLSSGVYFYRIQSGDFAATKKMILVK